ncbi:uncharacterized protein PRCAT00006169001 [Priceomyces carsonii]|uniref:uncharacterized protein n=1 Tax=Priceomyces carsonii TaxID=28549 RepID=UPI002EDA9913|nr:unnamed protein product [Priceomyces carsonii]
MAAGTSKELPACDNKGVFSSLTSMYTRVNSGEEDIDYVQCLDKLKKWIDEVPSVNCSAMLARVVVIVLRNLPTKIHDFAYDLLSKLGEGSGGTIKSQTAVVVLIDLFEMFPNSLTSLMNFSATQVYKALKKVPDSNVNMVYLLNSITKNATRADIDEKFQAKLLKLVTKNINSKATSLDLKLESGKQIDNQNISSIILKRNYILVFKNLLLLSISSHYESLLSTSASSSAGSKLKPESIMIQQHQFQTNLLTTNEKFINFGLCNYNKDIRIATVELLATVLLNFVPTGDQFNAVTYLIAQYTLPLANVWNDSLSATVDTEADSLTFINRKEKNTLTSHDSELIIQNHTGTLLFQLGIVETLIMYIQLEQFQDPNYLSFNLQFILDEVLTKFCAINNLKNHIQNQYWNKTLKHWTLFLDWILKESGSNCHEILAEYVLSKFNVHGKVDEEKSLSTSSLKEKKKESVFNFNTAKGSLKSRQNFLKRILPYHNSYQSYLLLYMIEILLPFGIDFSSSVQRKEEEANQKNEEIDEEQSQERVSMKPAFVRDIILKLLINQDDYIRNYALKTLLVYASCNEIEINQLILRLFSLVNQEQRSAETKSNYGHNEDNISNLEAVRLMSYSLALLSLIKHSDITLLQNATIVKILSFCTQNLKHNNNTNYQTFLKNSSCWVILSSLVTFYNDSEIVKLNSSQFLVFWKSLLTSQFISSSLDLSNKEGQQIEIIENLKMRNFSLVCLLNYLNSVKLTPESVKQLRFLLTKSFNYLNYLESNIPSIGPITNFSTIHFNESDYNPNLINNIQYSNYSANKKLSFENMMISLILYGKKILLLSFLKLVTLLSNDINSNIVLFLMKVFSDSKTFSRVSSEFSKEKSKASRTKPSSKIVKDYDSADIILSEDYNYSFGITSKFRARSANIDELLIKFHENLDDNKRVSDISYKDTFQKDVGQIPDGSIELPLENQYQAWFDAFEELIFKSVDNSINYDPNIFLLNRYSVYEMYSANLTTSLVDLSVELFLLIFPHLSLKIQFSLLEQMRNSVTAQVLDPLRRTATHVNASVALHGVLSNASHRNYSMDQEIVNVILDILEKLDNKAKKIVIINSDSVGLASGFLSVQKSGELLNKFVNNIVQDVNPFHRGWYILSLSKIYHTQHLNFSEVYSVASQLLKDSNPVVYYFSLEAVYNILESNLDNLHLVSKLLDTLLENYLNDDFGYVVKNKVLVNLKCKYGSMGSLTKLVRLIVSTIGPSLKGWLAADKIKISSFIIALSDEIGSCTIEDALELYQHLLQLFKELLIYDPKLFSSDLTYLTEFLNMIISKNLKLGITSISPTSINKEAIFPFNTSFDLYRSAYECYVQLVKIKGVDIFTKESAKLFWVCMNTKPCPELKELISLWLDSSLEINWLATLNSLFKYPSKKLLGPFIEINYQQKLLPLQQRLKKKKSSNLDFKDEEIENIVGEDGEDSGKNEPITWELKLFIYDLLNLLLEIAHRSTPLLNQLTPRIQDIVKISFLGSTSPIKEIKLKGINLLDKTLGLFGNMADPLYPGVSILEQQQAQIISALIPCFNADSDSQVIVHAINVSSKFINLPRIKFYSKQRILKTLIFLLEEVSSNKFLKFGFLEDMSEFSRKSIQLSILNCWALLKIDSKENPEIAEPEFLDVVGKYSDLLNPLWILVLRDFSALKYNDNSSKELEIYDKYWFNFINVLSLEIEQDNQFAKRYLSDDAPNFLFVLLSQCVESLIKNKNVPEILLSLARLVDNEDLVDLIFNDEIFDELVDLFDRLILLDDDTEVQCKLNDIINSILQTYVLSHPKSFEENHDKLLELIRLNMLPLFNMFPFLRADYDATNAAQKLALKHVSSASNLLIFKKELQNLVDMISKFPEDVKGDLYSCILFIFAKIYEFGNELLIQTLLPHLKKVVTESANLNQKLVWTFEKTISTHFKIDSTKAYTVLTKIVLITNGNVSLDDVDSKDLAKALLEMAKSKETASISLHCVKTLTQYFLKTENESLVLRYLVRDVVDLLVHTSSNEDIDPTPFFEMLFLFSKTKVKDEAKLSTLYSIIIPLLIRFNTQLPKSYLHERLMFLVQQNSNCFKIVVNTVISKTQRQSAEELLMYKKTDEDSTNILEDEPEIHLKTFGT